MNGQPRIIQPSDSDKRARYKYLIGIKQFVDSLAETTAFDFSSDNPLFDEIFSDSTTIIESGCLGLLQNTDNAVLVTDDQLLYIMANEAGFKSVGLCGFLIRLSNEFEERFNYLKKLSRLNFNNYFPLFVFEEILATISSDSDLAQKQGEQLAKWLLNDGEGTMASEHHANIVIQLYRDYVEKNGLLDLDDILSRIAIHHFSRLHPEFVENIRAKIIDEIKMYIETDDSTGETTEVSE